MEPEVLKYIALLFCISSCATTPVTPEHWSRCVETCYPYWLGEACVDFFKGEGCTCIDENGDKVRTLWLWEK
jgi:hypothetical protein